jgi:hypothetical protein
MNTVRFNCRCPGFGARDDNTRKPTCQITDGGVVEKPVGAVTPGEAKDLEPPGIAAAPEV